MAVAGTLTYKTDIDQSGIQQGMTKTGSIIKGVIGGLGIAKLVSSTMNVIKDSIDDASKRIDTLNNFPKVMQNFGVGADEASESVKRIDQSVRGLPTSLDQAVAGVQDLFMVTKDLKQSEKLFQAVNDSAMVFANGSTEAVNRFIYAYKQAMSAGKVSAQDFNQMNEAIPGLMSKVAEKMGVTYKELKEGLSDGSISIDQFNDTLKLLDTEGVGSMEALQKSAKTATGGIQTSIANMKTALTRGVANIITSIDKSLSSFGGLTGIITKIGKIAEDSFKVLGEVLKEIMPILIEFGKTIMPVIVNAFKQISPLISKLGKNLLPAIQKILQKLAPAISHIVEKLLPIAESLLNALMPLIKPLTDYILAMIDYTMALAEPLLNIASVILPPLISILSGLVGTILPLITGWIKTLTGIITGIPNVIKGVVDFIIGIPSLIVNVVSSIINFIKNIPEYVGFMIGYIAGIILKFVTQDIPNFINTAIGFIKNLPSNIANIFGTILSNTGKWLGDMYNKCKSAITDLVKSIVSWFKKLPGQMINIGKEMVHGLWKGILGAKDWIIGKIKSFGVSIVNGFKSAFRIGSPSKVMRDQIGQWIPKGIAIGIDANVDSVFNSLDDMYKEMNQAIKMENSKLSLNTISGDVYNKTLYQTPISIDLNADVEMDSQKVGRLITPEISRTIKSGGGI